MNFINLIDLFQFFVNEYVSPKDNVLILNYCDEELKKILSFIDCESFFVSNIKNDIADIVSEYNNLPFEDNVFDVIINFSDENNLNFLKKNGMMLTNNEKLIINNKFKETNTLKFKNNLFIIIKNECSST
jgi:hypothetical protein